MRSKGLLRLALGLGVFVTLLVVGTSGASAADVTHGIGFTKGCSSPTQVGAPYSCSWTIRNNLDDAQDTLTINNLTDTVHSAGGNVVSSTVLDNASVTPSGGATCTAPPNRVCTIPFNGRVDVGPFSFYTVQPADFALPGSQLTDSSDLAWHDLCDDPAHTGDTNCNPNPPTNGAASASLIVQRPSTTATTIENGANAAVTTVEAGSTVHDFVSVTGGPGNPVPGGNVTIDFFTNNQCTAPAAATSAPLALAPDGTLNAAGFAQGPLAAGLYGFLAHYQGDGTYTPSDGPCEPLRVVDANIQITPATATDPVGDNHVLTVHVNVNDGTGSVNAPDGTVISLSLTNAGGATATFVGPSSCTTAGGTGSCQVTISSPTAGTTTIHATTNVTVGGLSLTRSTGDTHAGDSADALKSWVAPGGLIAPTQTTCSDFTGGTAATLGQVNYSLSGGKIGQGINPGVFFFYTKITTTTANQVVTVTETNTSSNNTPNFGILNGQAWLYPADCSSHRSGAVSGPNGENASYTIPTPGTYIIGIKYQTKTIAGAPAPAPANITFDFATSLGGSTGASVKLVKQ
jgi:hypothetical protein